MIFWECFHAESGRFIDGWQHPGALSPLAAGTLAAAITTWSTFLPSLLLVLTGAPLVERLQHSRALNAALSGITAAVVGVMLNLAIWFGWHILSPGPRDIDWFALTLSILFFAGLRWRKWNTVSVIAAGALCGIVGKWLIGF